MWSVFYSCVEDGSCENEKKIQFIVRIDSFQGIQNSIKKLEKNIDAF